MEENKQEEKKEDKKEDNSILEETKKTILELRAENDRKEALIKQEEKLLSDQLLSPTSRGRLPSQDLTPAEILNAKAKEEADKIFKAFH